MRRISATVPSSTARPAREEHDAGRELLRLGELLRRQKDGAPAAANSRDPGAARAVSPRPSPPSARRGRAPSGSPASASATARRRRWPPDSPPACRFGGARRDRAARRSLARRRRAGKCARTSSTVSRTRRPGREADVLEHRPDRPPRGGRAGRVRRARPGRSPGRRSPSMIEHSRRLSRRRSRRAARRSPRAAARGRRSRAPSPSRTTWSHPRGGPGRRVRGDVSSIGLGPTDGDSDATSRRAPCRASKTDMSRTVFTATPTSTLYVSGGHPATASCGRDTPCRRGEPVARCVAGAAPEASLTWAAATGRELTASAAGAPSGRTSEPRTKRAPDRLLLRPTSR